MKSTQQPRYFGLLALLLAGVAVCAIFALSAGQVGAQAAPAAYTAPLEDGTPHPEATETHHPDATETRQPEATETEHPDATETRHPEATETEHPPEATHTSGPEATETEHPPEATETRGPEATETEHPPEATHTQGPEPTETHHPEMTQTPEPAETGTPDAAPRVPGSGSRTFPATGQAVPGVFLSYWDSHGGLAQQGYPISGLRREVSPLNGKQYTVQYFERAVFEYHPENQAPYNILLAQLGTFRYRALYPNGAPNQQANQANGHYFPETGKWVGGKFWAYWQSHGGLAQQGYPISNEFTEISPLDGKQYTVQYFERAEFELHPANQAPYDVLLAQLGTFRYQQSAP